MEILGVTASALKLLRNNIITGKLKPGERLNECDLSDLFNISRPPLREAFRLLERDQLVTSIPRRGTYVNELSIEDFTEVINIREMIECYAIDCIKSNKVYNLSKVRLSLDSAIALPPLTRDIEPDQLLNRIQILLKVHHNIVESAGNSRLIQFFQSISYNLARYQFIYFSMEGSEQRSLDEHQRILSLLENRKYEEAKRGVKKHVNFVFKTIKRDLRAHSPSSLETNDNFLKVLVHR